MVMRLEPDEAPRWVRMHEKKRTETFATAHSNTVTAYGTSTIHGLVLSSAFFASNRLGGAEEGMAFLPLAVTASGLDLENNGRINCWRIW
jgi:hypothetical protein